MNSDLILQFFEQLAESMTGTLAQLTNSVATHEVVPNEEQSENEFCANLVLQGEKSQQIAIGFGQKTGLLLARAMLSEAPGEDATLGDEDKELLAEFWRQAAGRASTDLKQLLGDSTLEYLEGKTAEWQPASRSTLTFKSDKLNCALNVRLSVELVRRIAQPQPDAAATAVPQPPLSANNLDLLLNVPLAVTLRFGQRRMSLRNILQLTSGSVIELDRQAEDPVDLLLDERLIARGQVVVVDGCYGLRVTEVCR